jgi:hypothetical protein
MMISCPHIAARYPQDGKHQEKEVKDKKVCDTILVAVDIKLLMVSESIATAMVQSISFAK